MKYVGEKLCNYAGHLTWIECRKALRGYVVVPFNITGWILNCWNQQWPNSTSILRKSINFPSTNPPGCNLPQNAWVNLNRLRSGVAKTEHYLHMIGVSASDLCECGKPQTVEHIINDCPIFKSPHGVSGLIELDDDTTSWLMSQLPV